MTWEKRLMVAVGDRVFGELTLQQRVCCRLAAPTRVKRCRKYLVMPSQW